VKARHAASIALAALLVLGTSGCTLSAVQGTLVQYQPSDGTAADIGNLKLRNVIGLTENGDDISLLMTLINSGDDDFEVTFQFVDADGEKITSDPVTVEANSSVHVGGGGDTEVVLRNVGVVLGSLVTVYVYNGEEGKELHVPTLDGSIAAYSDLLPGPAPTPTPTETATPEPTETPAA
jgi:hypothetical protein